VTDDRQQIEDLLSAYALSLDVDDVDGCVDLFTEDGRFEVYGRSFDGHGGLRAMMTAAPGGMHLAGRALITINGDTGDTAAARQQLIFIDPSTGEMRLAIYDDVIVRDGGRWRFRSRRCRFLTPDGLSDRPARRS
jgi:hypothetical protein